MEGLTYIFRVAAENQAGLGKFSDPSEPMMAQAPICTLTLLDLVFSKTLVSLLLKIL